MAAHRDATLPSLISVTEVSFSLVLSYWNQTSSSETRQPHLIVFNGNMITLKCALIIKDFFIIFQGVIKPHLVFSFV